MSFTPSSTRDASVVAKLFAFGARSCRSVRQHGPLSAARRGWLNVRGAYLEWHLGIRTRGSIGSHRLGAEPGSFGYQPIPYNSFAVALSHIPIVTGRDVFVDYGCGMGRAIVLAARLPFRRVVGVELSAELCGVARDNVQRAKTKLKCPCVEVVNSDASHYTLPDDASVLFLFNPFDEVIARRVLERIRQSLTRRPRQLSIVYATPKWRRDVLAEQDWLSLRHTLETVHSDWQRLVIYASGTGPPRCR